MSLPPSECTDESESDDNIAKNTAVQENSSSIVVTNAETAEEEDESMQAREDLVDVTEERILVQSDVIHANTKVNNELATTSLHTDGEQKIGTDKDTHENTDIQTDASQDGNSNTEPDKVSTIISTQSGTPRGGGTISPLNELLFDKTNVITTAAECNPTASKEQMSHDKAKSHQLEPDEIAQTFASQTSVAPDEAPDEAQEEFPEIRKVVANIQSSSEETKATESDSEDASAAMVANIHPGNQSVPETSTLSDDSSIELMEEPTSTKPLDSDIMSNASEESHLSEDQGEKDKMQDSDSFMSSNAFIEEEEEFSTTLTSDAASQIQPLDVDQIPTNEKQTPATANDTEQLQKVRKPNTNVTDANVVTNGTKENGRSEHRARTIEEVTKLDSKYASPVKEDTTPDLVAEAPSLELANRLALTENMKSTSDKPEDQVISMREELSSNERVVPFPIPSHRTPELVSEPQTKSPEPLESIDPAVSIESDRSTIPNERISGPQADDNSTMGPPPPRQPVSTNISPDQVHPYVMLQPHFAVQQPDPLATQRAPLVPSLQTRQSLPYGFPMQAYGNMSAMIPPAPSPAPPVQQLQPQQQLLSSGRRKIRLRLQEDVERHNAHAHKSWFRRRNKLNIAEPIEMEMAGIDRGSISVSWFEGTTSGELQEHVKRSVSRKMDIHGSSKLVNMRIIDESIDPPEEIVLSSFIPDGSEFLLRFSTIDRDKPSVAPPRLMLHQADSKVSTGPPNSPSAAPSPFPSNANLLALNSEQLQQKFAKLGDLNEKVHSNAPKSGRRGKTGKNTVKPPESVTVESVPKDASLVASGVGGSEGASKGSTYNQEDDILSENTDPVEARLQQIVDLLQPQQTAATTQKRGSQRRQEEKKQVIFVIANYFVLFLSLIAISAELQARAPGWMKWMEKQLDSVHQCSTDQESLFECVSNGDVSGLIATFLMWITRSAATKRIFLFGFETPKKLWTVVYESFVTAFCWGLSYTFIRRGLNPDTRTNFLHKYWKDAVYGSLAGFNASFMKAVLKNLIPQEAIEHALDDNEFRLKIFSWLPSMH
mmetsp:Transcript_8767/g.13444  ORF Transcript_8767/g.13444 Transcript_8767/m.13444 type:complete len:1055 (+) Transcript_8767:1648-4812(+)|eukprot:CAMPEP_0195298442 /NCGR_PEP_ID=MMETSP0707-20130614/23472_1 /TAXON_ID=33640 /ORGANISM="Asterionellopsis glacialis, Strain CCMP134" /LENGTH=1054 /DNA_ID=CAMNT_0040360557 /DNA_START=1586 /DNA_END=4750 /DNA_ORIENTATION=-